MIKRLSITVACLVTIAVFAKPVPVAAQASSIAGGTASCAVGNAIAQAITNALTGAFKNKVTSIAKAEVPVTDSTGNAKLAAQEQKMFTLDRLASCAAKQLLHQMTADTINWINSGFNGGPAFLSNPRAFLLDTADQLTGEMISNNGLLQGLCSPWNADIRLALALEQAGGAFNRNRYTCTLNTIIANAQGATVNVSIDGFLAGDFSQGGWDAFINMTAGSQNPSIQYLMAKSDLQAAIDRKTDAINKDLDRGLGFLSDTQCTTVNLQTAAGTQSTLAPGESQTITPNPDGITGQRCVTKTPGSVIANTLIRTTQSGIVQAELANDINAVVNALVVQLTSQMLTKGLSALSGNHGNVNISGSNNLNSYISQLQAQSRTTQTVVNQGEIYTIENGNISVETSPVVATYDRGIEAVTSAQTAYAAVQSCYADLIRTYDSNQNDSPYYYSGQNNYQPVLSAINTIIDGSIVPTLAKLNSERDVIITKISITNEDATKAQALADDAVLKAAKWNTDAASSLTNCQNSN